VGISIPIFLNCYIAKIKMVLINSIATVGVMEGTPAVEIEISNLT
jgi:hypothetical protein